MRLRSIRLGVSAGYLFFKGIIPGWEYGRPFAKNKDATPDFADFGRERRRQELGRQRALSLQGVEQITSVIILPHPERETPEVRRLQPDFETEAIAMRIVIEHEAAQGRQVYDVHEKNLGYDITSLDLNSGELRLIEVKGIGGDSGTILLTPNERRVAEDRRDCYWLYFVTNCKEEPKLQDPVKDPARLNWHEVKRVDHYYLTINALTQHMEIREESPFYSDQKNRE